MRRCLLTMCFVALAVSAVLSQQKKTLPSPPKPTDEGPSLEVTMKFIQDNLKDLGVVRWAHARAQTQADGTPQWVSYVQDAFSEVVADPSSCELTLTSVVHYDNFYDFSSVLSFRGVEKIEVMPLQDLLNRNHAQEGHPELQDVVTPAEFAVYIWMTAGKTLHRHVVVTAKTAEKSRDYKQELKNWELTVPDEDTANRVAKALVHAVELCGGGSTPELF
jgi:hypothetical protein